jgi:hypothetical protein
MRDTHNLQSSMPPKTAMRDTHTGNAAAMRQDGNAGHPHRQCGGNAGHPGFQCGTPTICKSSIPAMRDTNAGYPQFICGNAGHPRCDQDTQDSSSYASTLLGEREPGCPSMGHLSPIPSWRYIGVSVAHAAFSPTGRKRRHAISPVVAPDRYL